MGLGFGGFGANLKSLLQSFGPEGLGLKLGGATVDDLNSALP